LIPEEPVRHATCIWLGAAALLYLGLTPRPALAQACEPKDGNGCVPSPQQCATGDYNGYWVGSGGKFASCIGAEGHVLAYAGGTPLPLCGVIIAADQVVPGTGGDPNDCGPAYRASAPAGTIEAAARALGLDECADLESKDVPPIEFTECAGELYTFDGVGLDSKLTFPRGASGPLPSVLLLHGWSGNRFAWQHNSRNPDRLDTWGRIRFVAQGYATLAYTARGFNASCGAVNPLADLNASGGPGVPPENPAACTRSWTHIAERAYEVRDSQVLLGRLVDAGIADPARLAATGDSYGGGQSWLLATSLPWRTPAGNGPLQLAAAVPETGWTDLFEALVPNGRAGAEMDSSRSHERPFGVPKISAFDGLWLVGRYERGAPNYLFGMLPGNPAGFVQELVFLTANSGRYNDVDPAETHSFIDGWLATFNAGEPFDTPAHDALARSFRGKSAFYADEYLQRVAAREIAPVPVFAIQGWTDALFPAVQAVQMYRKLKAAHPGYPIWLALGDVGHAPAQNPPHQRAYLHELAGQFITRHLSGTETTALDKHVLSFRVQCGAGPAEMPAMAASWDKLTLGAQTFASLATAMTTSAGADPGVDAQADPFSPLLLATQGTAACLQQPAGSGTARWTWPLSVDVTLLGLPTVRAPYVLSGTDATVIAKVWDVAADATRTLVTRGVYRLSTAAGDPAAGTLSFQLFGSHWRFARGHRIELELAQSDFPFLQRDKLPSTIAWNGASIALPRAR
jgi:predicted acyl esterase